MVFLIVAFPFTCRAAEKIRYEELQSRAALHGDSLGHRRFKVTTLDGKVHGGQDFTVEPDRLRILLRDNTWRDLPNAQVSKIEIRKKGGYAHKILEIGQLPIALPLIACEGENRKARCLVTSTVIFSPVVLAFSPVWAYTAATAPFYLAAEGISRLSSPQIFQIVH